MKPPLLLALLLSSVAIGNTITVGVDLGPTGFRPATTGVFATTGFDSLNGVSLLGQSVSLDVRFADDKFVRIFTSSPDILISLRFATNLTGNPGFLGATSTGYLFDEDSNLVSEGAFGRAMSSNGVFIGCLFPSDLSGPLDFYGAHFDLVLPTDASRYITSSQFSISTMVHDSNSIIGIGPGLPVDNVPDTGGTAALTALGLIAMSLYRRASLCRTPPPQGSAH